MRKLKNLAIATITTLLLILTLNACGQDPAPTPTNPDTNLTQTATPVPQAPLPTSEPLPTKPTRLTNLSTPTQQPDPTPRPTRRPAPTRSAPETSTEAPSQSPEVTTESHKPNSPEDLIPADTRTNDQILLQDIYELMDLQQFALDPDQPLEKFQRHLDITGLQAIEDAQYQSLSAFPRMETENHPYIHLFTGLQRAIEAENKTGRPPRPQIPYNAYDQFTDPVSYFISKPWFEDIHIDPYGETLDPVHRTESTHPYFKYGPYWFGNNSTRGVLSEAIAQTFEDAALPTTEPISFIWKSNSERGLFEFLNTHPDKLWEQRTWKLDQYIRTTVNRYSEIRTKRYSPTNFQLKTPGPFYVGEYLKEHYNSPDIRWEFVHPKLPIIKITAQNSKIFPISIRGDDDPTETEYSISFVISFQNRWAALDDPNRWVLRFADQIPWGFGSVLTNNEQWNPTDYMPHQIIGPVVVQIHESPVFQPGIYSATPKVTSWEAPGYIATDDQMLVPDRTREKTKFFRHYGGRIIPSHRYPNANFPFPGHVVTDEHTQPGTKIWDEINMNRNDW